MKKQLSKLQSMGEPPSKPISTSLGSNSGDSMEEEGVRDKEVDAANKELKDKEDQKWENRRWKEPWADGLQHTQDGKLIFKPDNQVVGGVNTYS